MLVHPSRPLLRATIQTASSVPCRLFSSSRPRLDVRLSTPSSSQPANPSSNPTATLHPLTSRVTRITLSPSGPHQPHPTNVYLVGAGPHKMLIDAGNGNPASSEALAAALHRADVAAGGEGTARVDRVLLTHSHVGHVAGLPVLEAVAANWSRTLSAGRLAVERMEGRSGDGVMEDHAVNEASQNPLESMFAAAKEAAKKSAAAGENVLKDAKDIVKSLFPSSPAAPGTPSAPQSNLWISKLPSGASGETAAATRQPDGTFRGLTFLKEGDTIHIPGGDTPTTLEVVACPGHARDHACFYLREEAALFSGDAVSSTPSADPAAAPASHVVLEDLDAYRTTLEKLQRRRDPVRVVYPGHGDVVVDGVGHLEAAAAALRRVETAILAEIGRGGASAARRGGGPTPVSTADVVKRAMAALFGGRPPSPATRDELVTRGAIKQHLLSLEKRGRIRRRHLAEQEEDGSGVDLGRGMSSNMKGPGGLTMKQVFSAIKDSRRKDWMTQGKEDGKKKGEQGTAFRARERLHTVHQGVVLQDEVAWVLA
ncbi:Beta-lactamase-like protein 2 [Phlyctochytrium bullatum]|nr:Beta-lactamase-like protein 2 [Phlyctochytrium bullatum]